MIDSGVVDEDVESAELAFARRDGGAPVSRARDVEAKRRRDARSGRRVDFIRELGGLIVEHVADNDLRAFASENPRLGGALAARSAGNQRHFSFKPVHREFASLVVGLGGPHRS